MDIARRQRHALGEAADAHAIRTLADAPGRARGALATAIGRLAADGTADQALVDAAADLAHHARVLVAEHHRRLPGKQPLRRVDVRAADAGGVDVDDDLTGPGRGLGRRIDREAAFTLPGGDLHLSTSSRGCRVG